MRVILAAAACFELCAAQPWWNCQIVNENDAGHVCFVSDDSGNLFISHGLRQYGMTTASTANGRTW